jgi:hypothetical protein
MSDLRPVRSDVFILHMLWILFYLIQKKCVTFQILEHFGFCEMIQTALLDTNECFKAERLVAACQVIASLFSQFDFDYHFHHDRILQLIAISDSGSEDVVVSAASAFIAILKKQPSLGLKAIQDGFIGRLIEICQNSVVQSKLAFVLVISEIVESVDEHLFPILMEQIGESDECLFSVLAEITESRNEEAIKATLSVLAKMFRIAEEIGELERYRAMFLEGFSDALVDGVCSDFPEWGSILRCYGQGNS